ncbi:hypothetical protein MMC08_002196 [Hypocenomyce scalaris]|nr:hypothetical protein [Hypocenomyce scalaris]
MSQAFRRHRLKFIAGGSIAGLLALQFTSLNPLGSMLTTPGVRNVEDRFSAGGAKKSHTPGAATPTGSGEREDARTTKDQGVGSNQYEKDVAEQRPDPGGLDKAWNTMHHKQERGRGVWDLGWAFDGRARKAKHQA